MLAHEKIVQSDCPVQITSDRSAIVLKHVVFPWVGLGLVIPAFKFSEMTFQNYEIKSEIRRLLGGSPFKPATWHIHWLVVDLAL